MATETEEKQKQSGGNGRNTGRIEEIQGVVIEAVFPDQLPEINYAIYIERDASEDDEKISGSSSGNTASMTTPWISSIRPMLRFSVSVAANLNLLFALPVLASSDLRATLRQALGPRYDFQDFLGDLRLTLAVHLQREVLDDVPGVL